MVDDFRYVFDLAAFVQFYRNIANYIYVLPYSWCLTSTDSKSAE